MTFGHEVCGIVEEIGEGVETLKTEDHVLIPFNVACGRCVFCRQERLRQMPRIELAGDQVTLLKVDQKILQKFLSISAKQPQARCSNSVRLRIIKLPRR